MANRFLSNIRINDAYTFPASDGSNGQVIVTDGAGNLAFANPAISSSASVIYRDNFTGDGSTTVFYLQNSLSDEDQTQIYIDGVYQEKGTYSLSNNAITFTTAPPNGDSVEVISISGINVGPTTIYQDNFTGDGTTTDFTLEQSVNDEVKTMVYFNGVYQFKGTYSLNGTLMSFDTAPANGVAIEVISIASAAASDYNQKMLFYGKATEAISKGDAVMFAGAQGDHFLFSKATQAGISANHELFIGLASQDLSKNEYGYVTEFGNIKEIDTSDYTAGDILWFDAGGSTAGAITNTEPTPPLVKIQVAAVIRSHQNEGVLFVRPTWYHELGELHDVNVTSVADKDLLVWDNANGYWENSKTVDTLTGNTFTATTLAGTLSTAAQPNVTSVGTLSSLTVSGNLAVDTDTLYVDASSNEVGIGTTSPDYKLDVAGEIGIDSYIRHNDDTDTFFGFDSANSFKVRAGGTDRFAVTSDVHINSATDLNFNGTSRRINFNSGSGTIRTTTASDLFLGTNSTTAIAIDSSQRVGIGTTSPAAKLQISNGENTNVQLLVGAGSLYGSPSIRFATASTNYMGLGFTVGSAVGNEVLDAIAIQRTGNVGIGTTSPDQKLVINQSVTGTSQGIPATSGTTQNGILRLQPGGVYGETLDFGMNVASTYGWIQATNKDNLSVNYNLALNPNGGNVGIGTTSPSAKLSVVGQTAIGTSSLPSTGFWGQADNLIIGGDSLSGMTIYTSSASGNSVIAFADENTSGSAGFSSGGVIYYEHGTDNLVTRVNGGEAIRILDNRNVGIGTTSPGEKLHVVGSGRFESTIGTGDNVRTGLGHWDTTAMAQDVGGQLVLGYKYTSSGSYTEGAILKMYKENSTSGHYGSGLKFQVRNTGNNLSTKMVLSPSGFLGIGEQNPTARLHVLANGFPQVRINDDYSGGESGIRFRSYTNDSNDLHGDIFVQHTSGNETGRMGFRVPYSQERMTILSSGNVGIGVTSPSAKFQVSDGNNNAYIGDLQGNSTMSLRMHDNAFYPVEVQAYSTELRFNTTSSSGAVPTVKMMISGGGNVGINKTNPDYTLDVEGAAQFTDYVLNKSGTGSITNAGYVWQGKFTGNGIYIHLKTNLGWGANTQMYLFHFYGYAYGAGQPIDAQIGFYNYPPSSAPISVGSSGTNTIILYQSSDGYIVIRIQFANSYYTGLTMSARNTAQGVAWPSITATAQNGTSNHF